MNENLILRYVLNFDVLNRERSTFDNILNRKLFNSLFGACPASGKINHRYVINKDHSKRIVTESKKT